MKLLALFSATALVALSANDTRAAAIWLTDLPKAQAQAQAEGRHVLVNFTGSDWCGWCMKLRKDVFLKPEFESYARTNLVLVEVDFPKHKNQAALLTQANQRLATQFQVEAYPTLLVLNNQGAVVGKVSYANGGMRSFRAELEKILRPPAEPLPSGTATKSSPTKRRVDQASVVVATHPAGLILSKITGSKRRRQAVINNQPLAAGQSASIKLATGYVKVSCLEIRERSVIVTVDGLKQKRELRLASGI